MLENQSLRNEEAGLPNGHDAVSEPHLGVNRSTARPVSMFEPRDSAAHRPPIGRKVSHSYNFLINDISVSIIGTTLYSYHY